MLRRINLTDVTDVAELRRALPRAAVDVRAAAVAVAPVVEAVAERGYPAAREA
ncbi:MAG: hypothetical protein QOD45_523, partial [Pseudonocardiales bacterium]|nr:hypothetical protein [Pseudonocardiales bacterium]